MLLEVCWVLASTYRLSPAALADAVAMLRAHESLVLEQVSVVALAEARFRAHPGLSLADCPILESARNAGNLPLGTFDRRLGGVPGAQLLQA